MRLPAKAIWKGTAFIRFGCLYLPTSLTKTTTPCKINMEPKNEALIQMIFFLGWILASIFTFDKKWRQKLATLQKTNNSNPCGCWTKNTGYIPQHGWWKKWKTLLFNGWIGGENPTIFGNIHVVYMQRKKNHPTHRIPAVSMDLHPTSQPNRGQTHRWSILGCPTCFNGQVEASHPITGSIP